MSIEESDGVIIMSRNIGVFSIRRKGDVSGPIQPIHAADSVFQGASVGQGGA